MNIRMNHFMTEKDFDATREILEKLGKEDSVPRRIAFSFMRLIHHIEQATIPAQLPEYLTANLEQFYLNLQAVKETHNFTTKRIQSGLVWLQEQGLAEGYYHKDLTVLEQTAKDAINKRAMIDRAREANGQR